jgi:hypothetical protein
MTMREAMWQGPFSPSTEVKIKPLTLEQEVIMEFTGNLLSALNKSSIKDTSHAGINLIPMMRDVCTLFNDHMPQTTEKLSRIVGFDIRKDNDQITYEESERSIKKTANAVCKLLNGLLEKPEILRFNSETILVKNFKKFCTPEGHRYDITDLKQLILNHSDAGLAQAKKDNASAKDSEEMEKNRQILILINSGRYFHSEISKMLNLQPGEIYEVDDGFILDARNEIRRRF